MMGLLRSLVLNAIIFAGLLSAGQAQELVKSYGPEDASETLVLRSTTDIEVFGPVVDAFLSTRPGLKIIYEQWGSNDLYELSRKECRDGASVADLVISSGVHQMVKLVNEACAAAYSSRQTAALPEALRWRNELWGITREPAVIIYNRDLVPEQDVPRTRFDLLDLLRPAGSPYAGRVATYDIERSGLGYLFAFSDAREASTFGALQESFGRTQAVSTCCSADIIRNVAEGRYLLAYNVLGSYAQGYQVSDDRIGIVLPSDYTIVLSRALMIPKTSTHFERAAEFLDFLLSDAGVFALRKALLISPMLDTEDGSEAETLSSTALRPISLSPALMVALDKLTRETFLRRWRSTFPAP
ncbi:ABC transporter substrate-binding protein [Roseibium denhamense]|uniref:Iron(III) transport system substrate-binding protein n=1 Tax=Roseibium denhamense TaxID=76305 RepID=A0ABY1NGC8_9HYPH|nr:ABC transporter substrate-binding protein [Roseibium denhamense]MTI06422.1 ABC transporter substrate-binding protein [Roseibium denhamense]SMP08985.1 iron(III) transport system substrate-binding protein [Roseibium denhamense]